MMIFLADIILEAFACEISVKGFVSLDCVLLQYSFLFSFRFVPSLFTVLAVTFMC